MVWRWHWLARLANERGWKRGAELGVRRGHTSLYLVDHVPGLSMICVDLWAKGISLRYDRYNHDLNLRLFLERCAGKPIMTWRMSTHQAASCVEDGALDFVFIDANHDYEAVAQDLDDWAPKVSDMLAGHDWTEPGVSRAVNERFTDVVLGPDQCWRVCR